MTDERLATAIEAFREEHSGQRLDAAAIRRRVLAAPGRQSPRLPRLARWLPAAVLLLLGSVALAANDAVRPTIARAFAWIDGGALSDAARSRGAAPVQPAPLAERSVAEPAPLDSAPSLASPPVDPSVVALLDAPAVIAPLAVPPAFLPPSLPAVRVGDRAPRSAPSRLHAAPLSARAAPAASSQAAAPLEIEGASPPPAPVDGVDRNDVARDLALYRAAHRLHFRDHDPARALAAWDAYLTAFPQGQLNVEAAFNRALCLIKVGRTEEAKNVLARFAAGAFGGYRRTQAVDLLATLRQPRSGP